MLAGMEEDPLIRVDLANGRHYFDAMGLEPVHSVPGDGTSLETIGRAEWRGTPIRIDVLRIDIPPGSNPKSVRFRDLGTPASFAILDLFFGFEGIRGCPFHSGQGGVSLSEVPAIVRVGDRVRMREALDQLEAGILATENLDEARGEALTFLAVATAAMLEIGGSREMHRVQLDAARSFERLCTQPEIAASVRLYVSRVAPRLFEEETEPNAPLLNRAMALIERNFARKLSDASIAEHLGLSTSHFRHLFRRATGQPFHRYLVSLRLEKARQMLAERDMPVTEVASAVGFCGLSHFSRAFTQRFAASPSQVRRTGESAVSVRE